MTKDEIQQKVLEIFVEEFELNRQQLTDEATLYDDLGLDSLDAVDLVVALEKAFALKLQNEDDIRQVRTVGDLQRLILRLAHEAGAL